MSHDAALFRRGPQIQHKSTSVLPDLVARPIEHIILERQRLNLGMKAIPLFWEKHMRKYTFWDALEETGRYPRLWPLLMNLVFLGGSWLIFTSFSSPPTKVTFVVLAWLSWSIAAMIIMSFFEESLRLRSTVVAQKLSWTWFLMYGACPILSLYWTGKEAIAACISLLQKRRPLSISQIIDELRREEKQNARYADSKARILSLEDKLRRCTQNNVIEAAQYIEQAGYVRNGLAGLVDRYLSIVANHRREAPERVLGGTEEVTEIEWREHLEREYRKLYRYLDMAEEIIKGCGA